MLWCLFMWFSASAAQKAAVLHGYTIYLWAPTSCYSPWIPHLPPVSNRRSPRIPHLPPCSNRLLFSTDTPISSRLQQAAFLHGYPIYLQAPTGCCSSQIPHLPPGSNRLLFSTDTPFTVRFQQAAVLCAYPIYLQAPTGCCSPWIPHLPPGSNRLLFSMDMVPHLPPGSSRLLFSTDTPFTSRLQTGCCSPRIPHLLPGPNRLLFSMDTPPPHLPPSSNRLLISMDTPFTSRLQQAAVLHGYHIYLQGERGGSVVECRTPEREVRGSRPTAAVLCPWARHFTPRKYWLITQEAMAPSRYDWKIVDWDVKPQHNQPTFTSRLQQAAVLYGYPIYLQAPTGCCSLRIPHLPPGSKQAAVLQRFPIYLQAPRGCWSPWIPHLPPGSNRLLISMDTPFTTINDRF